MAPTLTKSRRVGLIDQWRGIMIIGVVIYHILFDITVVFGKSLPWFTNIYVFRGAPWLLAGSFMLISGISCNYSKSNLRRGIQTLAVAMAITAITVFFLPGMGIKFGILHLLGSCMLLYWALWGIMGRIKPIAGIALCLLLFILTFNIYYRNSIGIIGLWELPIPQEVVNLPGGFIIGLTPPGFESADYYPLIPWMFLFFTGAYWGMIIKAGRAPSWFYGSSKGILTWIGKRTMPIYLAHQPIALCILFFVFKAQEYIKTLI